jgi:O-antigen/teichoic acid export membrane protein
LVGRGEYRRLAGSLIVAGACRLVAPAVLLLVKDPTENLALVLVLGWMVAPAIPIFASRPFAGTLGSVRHAWHILRESLGVWPAYLAWQVNSRLDQLVLAVFVSAADLGRYAVCVGIAEVPALLASNPRQVVLARVSKSHDFTGVPRITVAILAIGAIGGALSAYFSAPLLAAVFGPEFRSASLVLGILLAATGFDIGAGLLNSCLVAVGRGRAGSIAPICGLSVTAIVLPVVVLLGGGIESAAAVRLIASMSTYLAAMLCIRRFSRSEVASP